MTFGKVDFKEASTIRGAVWALGGIIGTIFAFVGKDPTQVMLVAASVAGGLGVAIPDSGVKK